MKSLADKLRQEPGIDVKRLKVGMRPDGGDGAGHL